MTRRTVAALALAALVGTTSLRATVTLPTDLAEATVLATTIVRGRVVDVRAFADGPVLTAVTLAVSETLKGATAPFVTFTVPGGVIGRYESRVIGAPVLALDDDAYVFLRRAPGGTLWPVGLSAGVYKVQAGWVAPPVVAGATAPVEGPVTRGDARRRRLPASDFSGLVKLVLAGKVAAAPGTGRPPLGGARGGGGGQ